MLIVLRTRTKSVQRKNSKHTGHINEATKRQAHSWKSNQYLAGGGQQRRKFGHFFFGFFGFLFTFRDEPLADFPGEDGRVLAFVLLDLGDDGGGCHFGLGASDDTRRAGAHDAAVTCRPGRGRRCGQQFGDGGRGETAGCGAADGRRRKMMMMLLLLGVVVVVLLGLVVVGGGGGCGRQKLLVMSGQIVSRSDETGRVARQVEEPLVVGGRRRRRQSGWQTRRRRGIQVA